MNDFDEFVAGNRALPMILATVAHPDQRAMDPIPGRERFYRQHIDPNRWLWVVVDFSEDAAWVVTAVIQDNDPRG